MQDEPKEYETVAISEEELLLLLGEELAAQYILINSQLCIPAYAKLKEEDNDAV